jgi:enoyl-CoA hydratase/carnithine racemase
MSIGCISLNKPKALNALDLDMVIAIQIQLDLWRNDPHIAAIFIDSEGDRSFCAGGDIVSMYKAMAEQSASPVHSLPDFMADFFEKEYRLNYSLHAFPKPIICWGNGIIMGGGLGIFAGASHKIITETARVAMPEITIGLFPDVGASYFLNQMPKGVGKFLGLTAASINAADCINIGLADAFLPHSTKQSLLEGLQGLRDINEQSITSLIREMNKQESVQSIWAELNGNLRYILSALAPLADIDDALEVQVFLRHLQSQFADEKIVKKAVESFAHGSPLTIKLVIEQLKRAKNLSLAECLQMELSMAYKCSVVGEFQEGVRALLIDKDNKPKWLHQKIEDVPAALVQAHFNFFTASNNTQTVNPLHSLVDNYGENRIVQ